MHKPLVSVVMPVFNGAAFVRQAVESVLAQTMRDFELVIIDDASPDGSLEILSALGDPRMRVLQNSVNLGFGGNWNRCLAEARGEFVKLLPQDDTLAPGCLESQVRVLRGDTEARLAMTFSARNILGPAGSVLMRRGWGHVECRLRRSNILRRMCRTGTNPIGEPAAVLFRRSAALKAGLFNDRQPFVIDIEYWLRLLEHGDAIYIPESLCSFRVSTQSQSVRMAAWHGAAFSGLLDELFQRSPPEITRLERLVGKGMGWLSARARRVVYDITLGSDRGW